MASGTFTFFSRKLGKSVNINVVLPECECPENGFVTYAGIHTWDSWDAHIEEALDYQGLTPVR